MPTIQLPHLVTAVEVQPSTYNVDERTVEVVWATGQRSIRDPFPFDDPFVEELGMGANEVKLERLNAGAPVLDSHGRPTHKPDGQPGLQDQIGVVERAWVAGGRGHALIRFGVRDEIAWIRDEVAAGTFRNLSMRYVVHQLLDTGEFDLEIAPIPLPVRRAVSWTPMEISILPVPADFGTEVRAYAGLSGAGPLPTTPPASYPCELTLAPQPSGNPAMTKPTASTPAAGTKPTAPASPPVKSGGEPTTPVAGPAPSTVAPPHPVQLDAAADAAPVAAAPVAAAPVAPVAAAPVAPAAQVAPVPAYAAPQPVTLIAPPVVDEVAIATHERTRISDIYRAAQVLPEEGRDVFAQEAIDGSSTIDAFRAAVLERLTSADGQRTIRTQVEVTREEGATQFAGLEAAILHRCDPNVYKLDDNSRQYVGMPLLRVAEELLNIHSVKIKSRTPRSLASQALGFRAALTGSDFPNLLANVANKILQDAYELTVRTYREWTRRRTISDFKAVTSLILHGGSQLEEVPEDAEIKRGTISESAETWSLSEYAKIWALSRKAVINDDLSAFDDLPRRFAAQAANLESAIVYSLLIANAVMSDGVALFHATHNNLSLTTALNTAGVGVVRAAMQRQTDADGNAITVIPRHLVVPPELETAAAQMNAGIVSPDVEGAANVWRGTFGSIQTEPRLVATDEWYIAADPNQAPGIEYGFLAGENGPMVETRDGWEVLGTEIRVVHSFGAGVVDFRGLHRADV